MVRELEEVGVGFRVGGVALWRARATGEGSVGGGGGPPKAGAPPK